MTKHSRQKQQALRSSGTLNSHPEKVADELFATVDFFDPCDLLQVKYEMLRRSLVDGQPVAEAARAFGLSRPTFYKAREGYERDGLAGLLPAKPGPRRAHKLSEEVVAFLVEELEADGSLSTPELARRVQDRLGLRVHPRSIERALARAKKGGSRCFRPKTRRCLRATAVARRSFSTRSFASGCCTRHGRHRTGALSVRRS